MKPRVFALKIKIIDVAMCPNSNVVVHESSTVHESQRLMKPGSVAGFMCDDV